MKKILDFDIVQCPEKVEKNINERASRLWSRILVSSAYDNLEMLCIITASLKNIETKLSAFEVCMDVEKCDVISRVVTKIHQRILELGKDKYGYQENFNKIMHDYGYTRNNLAILLSELDYWTKKD